MKIYGKIYRRFDIKWSLLALLLLIPNTAQAKCDTANKLCVMAEIKATADKIEKPSWRDQAYRELAKSYTYEGHENKALALVGIIETPDTKAMTIRGIGMAAADGDWKDQKRYTTLFNNLASEAEKITHPPSYAIAYTYIAMAQAFAKDDTGAMTTARGMKNDALRNKAFGETAEIQAERGDFNAAMASIAEIGSLSFRNKAYASVARIFSKSGKLDKAYETAQKIDNAVTKTKVLQGIVNYGNEEETLPGGKRRSP